MPTSPTDHDRDEVRRRAAPRPDAVSGGYLTIARFSGDGDRLLATYRRFADVMAGVGSDHGLIAHAAAKTDDGFLIVNLWPSRAHSEAAAADDRRLRVIEQIGISPEQINHEHHDAAHIEVLSR